ncbi:MAG: DUF748 domain-containing protein [Paludibacterium sp.]|uniref:DUF748 domain-containing protein n=1 Tax=Paludibacterium sp. TaxID=1917523 RepID=UPI0025F91035|nr:DUF748 domain-containing protein [Paludibacterium sp.]MBV8046125.1 DUF748 domain-containing protein [Paludibacterium sp.]MBV8647341.1 DUF748 domain-containing protein [Paludibacterium sp.]
MPTESQAEPRQRKYLRHWRPVLIAVLVLWGLSWGFLAFAAPNMARDAAMRWAQSIGRKLDIGAVSINPWRMSVTLEGVRLADKDGSTMFAAARVELEALPRALLIGHWHASMLALTRPEIDLTRAADGSWNWARFAKDASGPGPKSTGNPPKIFLDWLSVNQGRLVFRDQLGNPDQALDLHQINLNLHDLSTQPGEGGYTLTASLGDKTRLKWRGLIGLDPMASSGRLIVSQLPLTDIWDYLKPYARLAPPAGSLSLDLNYVFDLKDQAPHLTLSTLYGRIDGLGLVSPDGRSHLALGQLALEDGILDLQQQSLFFKRVHLSDGQVDALRDAAGQVNWQAVLPPPAPAPAKPVKASRPGWKIQVNDLRFDNWRLRLQDNSRAQAIELQSAMPYLSLGVRLSPRGELGIDKVSANLSGLTLAPQGQPPVLSVAHVGLGEAALSGRQIHGGLLTLQQPELTLIRDAAGRINLASLLAAPAGKPAAKQEDRGAPWQVTMPRLAMADGRVVWRDQALARPAEVMLAPISGSLTPHSADSQVDVTFEVHSGGGQLNFDGQLDPAAPGVQGKLTARAVPLAPWSPYLLSKTPLSMPKGTLAGALDVRFAPSGWQVTGGAGINDLRIMEPGEKQPLLGWRALTLAGIKAAASPLALTVRDVTLDRPVARLMLDQHRISNLSRLFGAAPQGDAAAPAPAALPPKAAKPPLAFDVRMIHVRNADVNFADLGMKPAFGTQINHLSGSISGLSSKPGKRGAIALNGLVDQAGDVRVRGALAPLAFTDNADIHLMFRNIPLNSLDTYSENIAGWQIVDGKLSVELAYEFNQRKLNGDNRIVVDSIKLGQQVERPGVSRLPLSLAVMVLQDSNGRIDLHLPVSGDLDDPKFSYGGVVWQAFVNVIQKVVTAPFRALGELLGLQGFDDVRFVTGEATVTPPERQKLSQLAQMLSQRPQLRLTIAGTWDPVADRRQLARARIDRAILKAAGVALLPDEPLPAIDSQDVDMQTAIKTMYAERVGRLKLMARMVSGGSGPAFYDGLRQEAIAAEKVADADLLALANARAKGAQQFLAQAYPDLAARIALGTPKTAQASADGVPLAIDLTGR